MVDKEQELDVPTLTNLLKDKQKELTRTQKKLNKVEEKFIEIHEKQKLLTQDRDTFINFMHVVFPENILSEVLLPDDKVGSYDIEHLRQFWLHMKTQQEAAQMHNNQQLEEEVKTLREYQANNEDLESTVEVLQSKLEVTEKHASEYKTENASFKAKLAEKEHLSAHAQRVQEERDKLKEKIREMERTSSEQQAMQLMTAFSNAKSGGIGGSAGTSLLSHKPGTGEMSEQDKNRCAQLERELSQLTNKNLQLQDENEELKSKIKESVEQESPSKKEMQARMIEDEINDKVQILLQEKSEQLAQLEEQNAQLATKLQALTNQYAVMQSDNEIMKTKARQMLVQKEEEIARLKGQGKQQKKKEDEEFKEVDLSREVKQPIANDQPDSGASLQEDLEDVSLKGILPPGLDRDYVRNILLKYLEYMACGEEKEALTLEKVLFTVLEVTPQNLASLEKARIDNNSGLMSYIYSINTKVAKPMKVKKRQAKNFGLGSDSSPVYGNANQGQNTQYKF